jgi:hypothetical protein
MAAHSALGQRLDELDEVGEDALRIVVCGQ